MEAPRVEQDKQNELDYVKDIIHYDVVNPFVAGISFGLTWLATFYILKQKFNVA